MEIETTKGLVDESRLEKRIKTEDIPCGWSDETQYFLKDSEGKDELVRQDIHIRVKEGILAESVVGTIGGVMKVDEFISSEYRRLLQQFTEEIGDRFYSAYPELRGMAVSFNLPGFRLDIRPQTE